MEPKDHNRAPDYDAGYIACEANQPFDDSRSDEWKKGYTAKEIERLLRSVRYHAQHILYPDSSLFSCSNLTKNSHSPTGNEYCCYYYSCPGKKQITCKNGVSCIEALLADVLRLFDPNGPSYGESQTEALEEIQKYLQKISDTLGNVGSEMS